MSGTRAKRKLKLESEEEADESFDSLDDFEIPTKKKVTARKRKREEGSEDESDLESDDEPKRKKKRAKTQKNDIEEEEQISAGEEEADKDATDYEWHQCGEPYLICCSFDAASAGQENADTKPPEVHHVLSLHKKHGTYALFDKYKLRIAKCYRNTGIPFPFEAVPFVDKDSTDLYKGASKATIDAAKLWKFNVKFKRKKVESKSIEWELTIFINKARLEKLLQEGQPIPYRKLVVKALAQRLPRIADGISNHLHDKPNTPFKIDIPEKQPPGFRTKLFKYQLDAVSWMKLIEEKSKTALSTTYTMKIPSTNFTIDLTNGKIMIANQGEGEVAQLEFAFSGGVLADEMGLGKTAEVLGLMLANPRPLPLPPRDTRVYSKATLVISPNHLAKQWVQEAQKHIARKFKVILITTMPQYDKVTYGDIQNADMVVVSFQFLKNPSFNKKFATEANNDGMNISTMKDRQEKEHVFKYLYTKNVIFDTQNWKTKTGFAFDHFHWHRIIIDEGHETTDKKWNNAMFVYPSNYSWYVTGTPFPSREAKEMAFSITKFHVKTPVYPFVFKKHVLGNIDMLGEKLFIDNLFWRNTKTSVKGEMKVPPIVEELLLMEFSEVERAMYRDAQGDLERQRQICCHLQISKKDEAVLGEARKTLDEVRKLMIENKESLIRSLQKNIWETEDTLRSDAEKLLTTSDKKKIYEIEAHIQNAKTRLVQLKSDLNRQSAVLRFFQAIVPNEPQEQECTICFDQMKFAAITPCGHMFCDACIKAALKVKAVCPMCREKVSLDQVTLLKEAEKEKEKPKDVSKDLEQLIEAHGTKMAHLITYLRTLWTNKETKNSQVIVFSQWDNMLRRVGETLEENGIENVFVRGNVHMRNAAISKFKSSKNVKVIMLSLENAASGINLTEATHVVLIDPVAGTKAQAQAIEGQAIGRAHRQGQDHQVTVVRFIVKDSIEHEIYKRNTEVVDEENEETTATNLRESNSNLRKSIDGLSSPVQIVTGRNNNNKEVGTPTRLAKSGSASRLNNNVPKNNKESIMMDEDSEEEKPLKRTGSNLSLKNNNNNVNLKKSSMNIPKKISDSSASSEESLDDESESGSESEIHPAPKRKAKIPVKHTSSNESEDDE